MTYLLEDELSEVAIGLTTAAVGAGLLLYYTWRCAQNRKNQLQSVNVQTATSPISHQHRSNSMDKYKVPHYVKNKDPLHQTQDNGKPLLDTKNMSMSERLNMLKTLEQDLTDSSKRRKKALHRAWSTGSFKSRNIP